MAKGKAKVTAKTSGHPVISFYKMTGGGNDFVIFDNRKGQVRADYSTMAKKLCDRKFSIGADGLLALENSDDADFRMVYYNADGSRAEMCGNGARCIARFAYLHKAAQKKMDFMTDAGLIGAEIKTDTVKIKMSEPKNLKQNFPIKVDGKEMSLSSLNTGVPHAILMVSDVEKTDVQNLGRTLRYHRDFAPAGTNVNFVKHVDNHNLIVRTYERGVEGETLACGTGVVASSLINAAAKRVESPVACTTRGGGVMNVYFKMNPKDLTFTDVYLEGPAVVCFQGEVEI